MPQWTEARQDAAKVYDAGLNQIEDVAVPQVAPDRSHVYHLYTIRHPRRDALAAHLNANGVQTAINYPTALPFLAAYARFGHRPEQFPNASSDQGKILSLPMFAEITRQAAGRGDRSGSQVLKRSGRAYRSSAMTLPSFGSDPAPTSSTLPPSFVTARSVAASSF